MQALLGLLTTEPWDLGRTPEGTSLADASSVDFS